MTGLLNACRGLLSGSRHSATRRIRRLDEPEKRTLPIIAMSAHVFQNEISRHLDAGVDAFVGKPVSPGRLADALRDVLLRAPGGSKRVDALPVDDPLVLVDPRVLREDARHIGRERTARMIDAFRDSAPEMADQMSRAVSAGEWDDLAGLAHSLGGAAASLVWALLFAPMLAAAHGFSPVRVVGVFTLIAIGFTVFVMSVS